jgi:Cu(I)/Ag(I) efflux system membrane fusion protein
MKTWPALFFSLAAFGLGIWLGHRSWAEHRQPATKVRYYQDSMHPWVKSDRPGTCPICRMQLTPIAADEALPGNGMALTTLSPEAVTVAHVAAEPVVRRDVHRVIRVPGVFEALESRTAIVAAPAGGRIDFIAVDHPGLEIAQGETLARLFSPDLAQRSRFLRIALSNQPAASGSAAKASAFPSRTAPAPGTTNENGALPVGGYRLDLFMSDLTAPISGIVSERPVTLGQYVTDGQKIATVIDPSVLWFRFDAFDRQLPWIAPGQQIKIHSESSPGNDWWGTVAFVEPLNEDPRGLAKVRAAVTNAPIPLASGNSLPLRPGMFGEGTIVTVIRDVLSVPKSAVIYPGNSAWVYVEQHLGTYERRLVRLGREGDDDWEVLSGLEEGERVVTAGNVLIDAQATFEHGDPGSDMPADDKMILSHSTPAAPSPSTEPNTAAVSPARGAAHSAGRNRNSD